MTNKTDPNTGPPTGSPDTETGSQPDSDTVTIGLLSSELEAKPVSEPEIRFPEEDENVHALPVRDVDGELSDSNRSGLLPGSVMMLVVTVLAVSALWSVSGSYYVLLLCGCGVVAWVLLSLAARAVVVVSRGRRGDVVVSGITTNVLT